MKFLTIATVCALASSVSSLKISHLIEKTQSHQDWQQNPTQNNDRKNRSEGLESGNHGPREVQRGWHDHFDWKTWQNPCPNADDKTCWKGWFSSQFTCKPDDQQCWKDSFKKLPCPVAAQKCWTDHISTFPCKEKDSSCWNEILPQTLPCKSDDFSCWKKLRQRDQKGNHQGDKRHQAIDHFDNYNHSFGLTSDLEEDDNHYLNQQRDRKGQFDKEKENKDWREKERREEDGLHKKPNESRPPGQGQQGRRDFKSGTTTPSQKW